MLGAVIADPGTVYTITGISDASYYAHLATLNRNFQELEDSMAIFRQVRNWQHRHM